MMRSLRLNEGDPVRITGNRLPKGKFVKLQAQSTTFLEISDPKAVYGFLSMTLRPSINIMYLQFRAGSSQLLDSYARRYN